MRNGLRPHHLLPQGEKEEKAAHSPRILTNHRQSACLASTHNLREATPCPLCWPSIRAPHLRAPLYFAPTFPSPPLPSRNSRSIFRLRARSRTSQKTSGSPPSSPP